MVLEYALNIPLEKFVQNRGWGEDVVVVEDVLSIQKTVAMSAVSLDIMRMTVQDTAVEDAGTVHLTGHILHYKSSFYTRLFATHNEIRKNLCSRHSWSSCGLFPQLKG